MATVAVLGAGGVGGTIAVRLGVAGNRVICIARPDSAEAIGREGLTLEAPDGTFHFRPEATEHLGEDVDLLVIAVKAYDLAAALERVRAGSLRAGVGLALLNGLEHMETIRARLGPRVVAGSIGRLEAYRRTPVTIVQSTPAPLVTVSTQGLRPDELAEIVGLLQAAGLETRSAAGDEAVLWEKAARLAPLAAVTAATRRTLGELRDDDGWRSTLAAAVNETCAVALAAGVDISPAVQWEMIAAMPGTLTTSTARDVAAGRASEIDAIAGSVVRAARRLHVPTPTLDRLLGQLEPA